MTKVGMVLVVLSMYANTHGIGDISGLTLPDGYSRTTLEHLNDASWNKGYLDSMPKDRLAKHREQLLKLREGSDVQDKAGDKVDLGFFQRRNVERKLKDVMHEEIDRLLREDIEYRKLLTKLDIDPKNILKTLPKDPVNKFYKADLSTAEIYKVQQLIQDLIKTTEPYLSQDDINKLTNRNVAHNRTSAVFRDYPIFYTDMVKDAKKMQSASSRKIVASVVLLAVALGLGTLALELTKKDKNETFDIGVVLALSSTIIMGVGLFEGFTGVSHYLSADVTTEKLLKRKNEADNRKLNAQQLKAGQESTFTSQKPVSDTMKNIRGAQFVGSTASGNPTDGGIDYLMQSLPATQSQNSW